MGVALEVSAKIMVHGRWDLPKSKSIRYGMFARAYLWYDTQPKVRSKARPYRRFDSSDESLVCQQTGKDTQPATRGFLCRLRNSTSDHLVHITIADTCKTLSLWLHNEEEGLKTGRL